MTQELQRGDLLKLRWADITEDSVGDPSKAACDIRTTYALWWREFKDAEGREYVVTTNTLDGDSTHQQGWTCYPKQTILSIEVIRRARRRRKKHAAPTVTQASVAEST